ncbi:hypothetical protein AsAng_0050050 [Aureispira anguillae]|uniref:Uncharacterized protein n=1 Tax=Aureispira anguillae TaxID=2864201 RepID=A0A916DVC5_9BACT|nr:hypothetical protein AsAng_0050050 [Aureispira anguillae]
MLKHHKNNKLYLLWGTILHFLWVNNFFKKNAKKIKK